MIDIKREDHKNTHCGKCDRLINIIMNSGIEKINGNDLPCLYHTDDLNKYLLQCIVETIKIRQKEYLKPIIHSDGRWDHYYKQFPDNYNMEDFIVNGDTDILLVTGEAGIGKSRFLNELYFSVALYSLYHECNLLPIMLNAESFGNKNISPAEWIDEFLKEKYRYLDFTPAFFDPSTKVIIFIDAINDIQYTDYNDFRNKLEMWQEYIEEAFGKYFNISFVISSRYLDYLAAFEQRNFTRLFIQPFDDSLIEKFIHNCVSKREKEEPLLSFVRNNSEMPFLRIPFFLNKIIEAPLNKIKSKTDVVELFIDSIFQKGNRYIKRNRIQRELLGRKYYDVQLKEITFISALSILAFNNQKGNKTDISKEEVSRLVKSEMQHFIDLAKNNAIFEIDKLKFTHSIFQEYLAGRYIIEHLGQEYEISDLLLIDDERRLIQSLKHVYNMLENKERFIRLLLDNKKFLIAAECVLENPEIEYADIVADSIVNYLDDSGSIMNNYMLGMLLGKLGDKRFIQGGIDYYEPQTVKVPTVNIYVGRFPITNREFGFFIKEGGYINADYWKDSCAANWFNQEVKIQSIFTFWHRIQSKLNKDTEHFFEFCRDNKFDKELIANIVFFKKIPENDLEIIIRELYNEERDKKPLMWDNPLYNNPSQPVTGISIYEAFAYCKWLSKKTGKKYRLLSSQEWEQIAHADQKIYVYGNSFNPDFSNTAESKIERIIPVGMCKYNITCEGVFDMTGNIFEWTSTVYDNSTIPETDVFKQYICKGGSWVHDALRAKSTYTGRGMGWVRNIDLGFRVCCDEN